MENSDSVVNWTQNSSWKEAVVCKFGDIQYWGTITLMYGVTEDGDPLEEEDSTDMDFYCYYCFNCEREFQNFKQAKEHLNE